MNHRSSIVGIELYTRCQDGTHTTGIKFKLIELEYPFISKIFEQYKSEFNHNYTNFLNIIQLNEDNYIKIKKVIEIYENLKMD